MRNLSAFRESDFEVVAVTNNALAHLFNKSELTRALQQIASKLRPGGLFLATIRDYDQIWEQHPVTPPPAFFQDGPLDLSIIKSWDGSGDREYTRPFVYHPANRDRLVWSCEKRQDALTLTKASRESLQNGPRMRKQNRDAPEGSLWLMENSQLPQNHSSVVVDSLSCQTVISTEGVHATKRNLYAPSRCGKTSPRPQLRAADDYLEYDCLGGDVPAHDLNVQVRQSGHKLRIELAHLFTAFVMLIPRFIIVACRVTEGLNDAFKVVLVFQAHGFFTIARRSDCSSAGTGLVVIGDS